jgi:hypothetical protein
VTGRILTPDGNPAAGVRVAAAEIPQGDVKDFLIAGVAETDKDGRYRLEELPSGRYYIGAGALENQTYYPGTKIVANAKAVVVGIGSLVEANFSMMPPVRLSGRVQSMYWAERPPSGTFRSSFTGPKGPPQVLLHSVKSGDTDPRAAAIGDKGVFEFIDVPPGVYVTLLDPAVESTVNVPSHGSAPNRPGAILVGERDVTGLLILPPEPISGRVVVADDGPVPFFGIFFFRSLLANSRAADSATTGAGLAGLISAWPAKGTEYNSVDSVNTSAGPFFAWLPKGMEYNVDIPELAEGYFVKSITYGNKDILNTPLKLDDEPREIVVTLGVSVPPPWTSLGGRFIGGAGSIPVDAGLAMKKPGVPPLWTAIRSDGSFEFPAVTPGRYEAQFDPDSENATRFSLDIPKGGLRDVIITLPRRVVVNGKVSMEGGQGLPPLTVSFVPPFSIPSGGPVRITPVRADVPVLKDGSFSVVIPEGEYQMMVSGVPPESINTFTDGATDLRKDPLKIAGPETKSIRISISPQR